MKTQNVDGESSLVVFLEIQPEVKISFSYSNQCDKEQCRTAIYTEEQTIKAIQEGKIANPYYLYNQLISRAKELNLIWQSRNEEQRNAQLSYERIANALKKKHPQFIALGERVRKHYSNIKEESAYPYDSSYCGWPEDVPYPFGIDKALVQLDNLKQSVHYLNKLRYTEVALQETPLKSIKNLRYMIYDYVAGTTVPHEIKTLVSEIVEKSKGKRSFLEKIEEKANLTEAIDKKMTCKLLGINEEAHNKDHRFISNILKNKPFSETFVEQENEKNGGTKKKGCNIF